MIKTEITLVFSPSLKDIVVAAEGCLRESPESVRLAFWVQRMDETVTLSERLAASVDVPDRAVFAQWHAAYKEVLSVTPDCDSALFVSWSCCTAHTALHYISMLLCAIAYAYNVQSEGQPLSEYWWRDFNNVTADIGCEKCGWTGEEWGAVAGGRKWTGQPCPHCSEGW